jgi:hypothetical protein
VLAKRVKNLISQQGLKMYLNSILFIQILIQIFMFNLETKTSIKNFFSKPREAAHAVVNTHKLKEAFKPALVVEMDRMPHRLVAAVLHACRINNLHLTELFINLTLLESHHQATQEIDK